MVSLFRPGSWLRTITGALVFLSSFLAVASAVNVCSLPSLVLLVFSRKAYRTYIRYTQQVFASWIVIVTWACAGPIELVLTGDYDRLAKEQQVVIMANHQTYTDWWWIWLLARRSYSHGDLFIMLMDILKYIPIAGQGMWFFDFIFLKRKWALDKQLIHTRMTNLRKDGLPYWLIIFPEGTLNTPPGKKLSNEYAKKMDISPHPVHVLLPRSTGLQYCCTNLQPELQTLYDLTIGYSGISADEIPYYKHLPSTVYFAGNGPRRVYIHVKRFDLASLPGMSPPEAKESSSSIRKSRNNNNVSTSNGTHKRHTTNNTSTTTTKTTAETEDEERKESFNLWVRDRFYEKDAKLVDFFERGEFRHETGTARKGDVTVIKIIPTLRDWLFVTAACSVLWFCSLALLATLIHQFWSASEGWSMMGL
ncbi:hypothetical protein SmJEL517_g04383 [Synchytrium microbalum]|uniref:Phospholipid/glycerol acyltransferase domain-containing protein n=1 Tax=Synchytrium microbalum TaxID=1806994 RepID=A0A507C0D2_9FUNG|nr:uncharacterized protein SmJEL517_g04383 [Synchytrium microbalum]TPX32509.1 hypothetical protein SmJEL517_g04383 [Synchytrium microbalum]